MELRYSADGLDMCGQLCLPAQGERRPGVLVFPEGFGLGAFAKATAERLAAIGFVALACDLHGGGSTIANLDEVLPAIAPLHNDRQRMLARAKGGFDALRARPEVDPARIASIGFCFGGTMALELARSGADVAATVGFHCGLGTGSSGSAASIRSSILVCIGADDPVVPLSERLAFEEEMRAGNVAWRMNIYGGVRHSFTNPTADTFGHPELARYDAGAEAAAWREMLALFDAVFAA
ncbi:dienelactone hydrolase family protein [Sphingomonas oryzagri]